LPSDGHRSQIGLREFVKQSSVGTERGGLWCGTPSRSSRS
jgi:hypothetical protein